MKTKSVKVLEVVIPLQVKKLKGGEYLATSRALPGLIAQGRTITEAMEIAQDVARKLIDSYHEHGDPLPLALRKQLHRRSSASHLQIPIAVNY